MSITSLFKAGRTRSAIFMAPRSARQARTNFTRTLLDRTVNLATVLARLSPGKMKALVQRRLADFIAFGNDLRPEEIDDYVELLGAAVRQYNPRTADHQDRVAAICAYVADRISRPVDKKNLRLAARLHDLGKIGLPASMWAVPVAGNGDLRKLINTHLYFSLFFIEAIHELTEAAEIVRDNHVFDGYPAGRNICEMSLEGHILAAADQIDALTSPRAYRQDRPMPLDEALSLVDARDYPEEVKRLIHLNATSERKN